MNDITQEAKDYINDRAHDHSIVGDGIIVDLIAEIEKHRWIPIGERQPSIGKSYQTYGSHSLPVTLYYDEDGWCDDDEYLLGITHWKELYPPKEK